MRLVMRLAGLVLLAASLVFVVVDGTRTLAANAVVLTPIGASWQQIDVTSFAAVRHFVTAHLGPFAWTLLSQTLLGWPGFAVLGVPAVLLVIAGWSRHRGRRRLPAS